MRKLTSFTSCLFLAGLLAAPFAHGQDPRVRRSIPSPNYANGDTIPVTLSAAALSVDIDIEETIPGNFSIVDDGGGTASGQTLGFTVPASGGDTPPMITEVIRGGASAEPLPVVVEAGLIDGALVFNDRTHVFSEVAGTIVEGATYVQVSNDDKNTADYSLDVTVDQDTVLYVIVDDRVGNDDNTTPPDLTLAMTWLPTLVGFEDTGAKISIDENGDGSINQYYTIYSVDIEADTPLTLFEQNDGGGRNMYSVAVPPGAPPVTFTYQIQATSCEPGVVSISGTATAAGGGEVAVEGDSLLNCLTDCGLQVSGGVSSMLIVGPIALASDNEGGNCDDYGAFVTSDYLTNGIDDETNILLEEGDDVEPDFGGASPGVGVGGGDGAGGVIASPNIDINPGQLDGTLTVWKADADLDGAINFNDADNIGDPVDDYVVYCISYLDNTTAGCLDTILEIGSDDAVKVLLNGQVVHTNPICRGVPAYGAGDMVPVILTPGTNVLLIAVCENGGGTGVRLVVRDAGMAPVTDGSVVTSCTPPGSYPAISEVVATRSIDPTITSTPDNEPVTVTISLTGVTGATEVTDSFPPEMEVVNDGGGSVSGNTITFNTSVDGDLVYTLQITGSPDECPFTGSSFIGTATPNGSCGATIAGDSSLACVTLCPATPESDDAELVWAFTFGSRDLQCPVVNEPDQNYTTVLHVGGDPLGLAYPDPDLQLAAGQFFPDEEREWGFEILYRDPSLVYVDDPNLIDSPFGDRAGFGIFGPFDDSANNRNEFGDDVDPCLTDRIYDSFIGAKDFTNTCDTLAIGDGDTPCGTVLTPEGIIFRVDVPNGTYKFVVAVGDGDNPHAHRVVAENGGAGTPDLIGEHVVLISNHDQAQYDIGDGDEPGDGVYGATGFGDKIPPPAQGVAPIPKFVFHDSDGLPTTGCPDSPALEVTEGYIRIHALQGNSNDGPGGVRDPNGGDFVVLEIWNVGDGGPTGDEFARGDADANGGAPNITDGIYILNFLFLGGPPPPCRDAADADDNGDVNITDGIFVLNFLFLGGPPPPAPQAPTCGEDPTGDALDCASFLPCE